MDNQTHNSENAWVDSKVASLVPPGDWHPDSKRAFAQFLKRRDRHGAEASPRWIRLSMAAAILASIGLVVTLLPWHALWKSACGRQKQINSWTCEGCDSGGSAGATPLPPAPKPPVRSQPPAPQQEQKSAETAGPAVARTYRRSSRAHILGLLPQFNRLHRQRLSRNRSRRSVSVLE